MARIIEPSKEMLAAWNEWVAERPESVRIVAEKFDPWTLYKLKDSGHRVTLHSISEDGTLTVNVSGDFNQLLFERKVFGIPPNDLDECDLPSENEKVGSLDLDLPTSILKETKEKQDQIIAAAIKQKSTR